MGHIRLGSLPTSRKWKHVVGLIGGGAGTSQVAAAALDASQAGFTRAAKDEGLIHAVWLLAQISQASRSDDFVTGLRKAGLPVSDQPTLLEITGAFTDAVDAHLRQTKGRTDVGEMAQMAAAETITSLVGPETQSLFGTTSDDVKAAFRKFSTQKEFGTLGREFFAKLTKRYLGYFLSRELSKHVGGKNGRFANIEEHAEFNKALEAHCHESARIVQEFTGSFLSKTKHDVGDFPPDKARDYVWAALKKIGKEFAKRGETGE